MSQSSVVEILSWEGFGRAMRDIAYELDGPLTGVYGIPRGGLVPAVVLSHLLDIPLLGAPCEGCVVIDDICDTGRTLRPFVGRYRTVAVYDTPSAVCHPDVSALVKGDAWIRFPWEVRL